VLLRRAPTPPAEGVVDFERSLTHRLGLSDGGGQETGPLASDPLGVQDSEHRGIEPFGLDRLRRKRETVGDRNGD
jgi:hypothetical protein